MRLTQDGKLGLGIVTGAFALVGLHIALVATPETCITIDKVISCNNVGSCNVVFEDGSYAFLINPRPRAVVCNITRKWRWE